MYQTKKLFKKKYCDVGMTLIHHWLQRTGNKKIWLRWLSLATKEMKSKSGWTSKRYHSNPYICSCLYACHSIKRILHFTVLQPAPHTGRYGGWVWLRICVYIQSSREWKNTATDVGIAVIPFWCSFRFWFHFFCSQWQPPQSYFLISCSL